MKKNHFTLNKNLNSYFFVLFVYFAFIFSEVFINQGRDFKNYQYAYNNLGNSLFEPVFNFYMLMMKEVFCLSAKSAFILLSLITIAIKLSIVRVLAEDKTIRYLVFCVMYFGSFTLLHDFTQFRVSLALSFVLFSMMALYNDRKLLSILFVILGFFSHNSVFIFFVAPLSYWFLMKYGYKKYFIIYFLVTISLWGGVSYFYDYILLYRPTAKGYLENWNDYSVSYISIPKFLTYFVFSFAFYIGVKLEKYKYTRSYVDIIFLYSSLAISSGFIFTTIPEVSIRYFDIATMIECLLFVSINHKSKRVNIVIISAIFTMMMYRFIGYTLYLPLFSIENANLPW